MSELYVAKVFLATSSDGEDGFKTFEVCGTFINVPRRDRLEKALRVTHYKRHKPPIQTLFLESSDFCSNNSIDIVNFFASNDVLEFD